MTIGGKHGAEALRVLASPETGGTFTCPECVKHYQHAKDWEKRYYRLRTFAASLLRFFRAEDQTIAGTEETLGQRFAGITGQTADETLKRREAA